MDIAQVLHTIAVVSAWARRDEEAVHVLIKDGGPDLYCNLIELLLMVIGQNTGNNPQAYLEFLSEQAITIQAHEAGRP